MTITLKHCTIVWTPEGCDTRFHDGAEVGAQSHPGNPHYHVIAHRLGYGDDLLAYTREHEFCHSFVAERLSCWRSLADAFTRTPSGHSVSPACSA